MIQAYRILVGILYPILFLFLYLRVFLKKEDPQRFKEKIFISHFNINRITKSRLLWFHAASVGELKSIIPIIKKLNQKYKNFEFLVTTITLSSGNLAEYEFQKFQNIHHRYIPLDINFLLENFINSWKPERIFLVDSEIWPNLILKAEQKKIPIALVNARLTKKSFKRWFFFPKTAKRIFNIFDLCICSNKETRNFLEKMNAKNIKYFGNIKLINDVDERISINDESTSLAKLKFWVAASIHEGEDIFCLKTHIKLKESYKDIVTIIAPRHINRVNRIKSISETLNLKTQILNKKEKKINADKEIIIINSYGNLKKYYEHSKSVFVGKSMIKKFKDDGGQSPIDAAYMNCKIYHGPYVSNFTEIYAILKKNNISEEINNINDLTKHLLKDFKNSQEKKINISKDIKKLGQNIFFNTIESIEIFLNAKI